MNLEALENVFPGLGEDEQKRRRRAKGHLWSVWSKHEARQREINAAALQESNLEVVRAELDPISDDDIYITGRKLSRWSTQRGSRSKGSLKILMF